MTIADLHDIVVEFTECVVDDCNLLTLFKGYYEDIPQELLEKKINLINGTHDGYLAIVIY